MLPTNVAPATAICKKRLIVILIISYFSYVLSIQNVSNNKYNDNNNNNDIVNNTYNNIIDNMLHGALKNPHYVSYDDSFPQNRSQSRTTSFEYRPSFDQHSNNTFRPSPMIGFTTDDALIPPYNISGSYNKNKTTNFIYKNKNETNIKQKADNDIIIQNNNRRYVEEEKQFVFPTNEYSSSNNNYYINEVKLNEATPIYTNNKASYTNENYDYVSNQQQLPYQREYLVQSTMMVGSQQHQNQQQQRPEYYNKIYAPYSQAGPLLTAKPYEHNVNGEKENYAAINMFVNDDKKQPQQQHFAGQTHKLNTISYNLHDYPTPPRPPPPPTAYNQQHTSNFLPFTTPTVLTPTPLKPTLKLIQHRPFTIASALPPSSSSSLISTFPNYANNKDNYLSNAQSGPLTATTTTAHKTNRNKPPPPYHNHHQYNFKPQRPPPPPLHKPTSAPSTNSGPPHYDYQTGELPPSLPTPANAISYRPPFISSNYVPHQSKPSTLASLTQYAPQFTSLLLGGSPANTYNPLPSLLRDFSSSHSNNSPAGAVSKTSINSQLIKSLENIARNDDLQCVPKVLCQMIAARTQRGQLPDFFTSPSITNFLAGFPASSPALIYGRAALLGVSGGDRSCQKTYLKCPKNEYEIIYYLNNHRGGFFKFFSEPEATKYNHYLQQQQISATASGSKPHIQQEGTTSPSSGFLSILAALTGNNEVAATSTTIRPQTTNHDIMNSIGNFFVQMLKYF